MILFLAAVRCRFHDATDKHTSQCIGRRLAQASDTEGGAKIVPCQGASSNGCQTILTYRCQIYRSVTVPLTWNIDHLAYAGWIPLVSVVASRHLSSVLLQGITFPVTLLCSLLWGRPQMIISSLFFVSFLVMRCFLDHFMQFFHHNCVIIYICDNWMQAY